MEAVAAGRMDPTDAADALADLDNPPDDVDEDVTDEQERIVERRVVVEAEDRSERQIRTVKVDGSFRSIEIIGDDDVREAVAEGQHRLRWDGDVLVIDGTSLGMHDDDDDDDDEQDEDFEGPGDWFRVYAPHRLHRVRMSRGFDHDPRSRARPLRVRMNPDLAVDARVEAGPLTIRRVRGPVKARVSAGPLVIEGFESPLDVRVAAGKVSASGRVDHGVSTINCDAGKVSLHLQRGSDVRVTASATLGKVDIGHAHTGGRERARRAERYVREQGGSDFGERIVGLLNNAFSDEHEVTFGAGTGVMDIRVSMGSADISFEDEPTS
ncbi:MAG: hypothetical protein QOF21_2546 [Actinomycetota bacterium]